MSHGLVFDPRLYVALLHFDAELADDAQQGGCACGGRLHHADYPRKPRGGPTSLDPAYARRTSFCCDRDGCRKRTTPASVRFLGRRVYLAAVFVLVSAMRHGVTTARWAKLAEPLGVSVRTLRRWRQWWIETFVASTVWARVCGRIVPPPDVAALPSSWLACFGARHEAEQVQWILAWLRPLTTRSPGKGAGLLPGF